MLSPRLWRMLGMAIAVTAISMPAVRRAIGRRRLRFEYATGALAPEAYAALAARPGWRAWQVPVGDGLTLQGLVRRPAAAGAPWVLYVPGNDPAQLRTGQALLEQLRGSNDWGLAVAAFRGFDGSGGTPVLVALRTDGVATLAALLRDEHLTSRDVHLVAFSIGGNIAAAMAGTQAQQGAPVASLTLLASVDDIVMVRRSFFSRVASGDDYQTRPLLAQVPAPVLVVQGTNDEALGGPQQGRDIAATLGAKATYVELDGMGHTALMTHAPTLDRVRAFIGAHQRPLAP